MYYEFEHSRDSGSPVELYEFSLGNYVWRYTSADADQTWNDYTWSAIPLSRSEIEETAEISQATLKMTVTGDHDVAELYRKAPPAGVVLLKIRRRHRGDPTDAIVVWMGRVLNCEWAGHQATLAAEPVYTSIRQTGLRRMYSRSCPHVLYGTSCRVDAAAFAEAVTVNSVNALALGVSGGHAGTNGWWTGGLLHWNDGTYVRRMGVESHSDGVIRLMAPLWGLAEVVPVTVTLYPGCDHSLTMCRERFSNQANFGGFKWIPNVNPFTTAVF